MVGVLTALSKGYEYSPVDAGAHGVALLTVTHCSAHSGKVHDRQRCGRRENIHLLQRKLLSPVSLVMVTNMLHSSAVEGGFNKVVGYAACRRHVHYYYMYRSRSAGNAKRKVSASLSLRSWDGINGG